MIDWFASKISMLIFTAVALSLLLLFLGAQLSAFDFEKRVRAAEDVAQLINTVPINGNVEYEMKLDKYNLVINARNKTISINTATRNFFVNTDDADISNAEILEIAKNSTGYVSVSAK